MTACSSPSRRLATGRALSEGPAASPVRVRVYVSGDQGRVIALWHASKRDVYTFIPIEQTYTLDDDTEFFRARIEPRCELVVAQAADQIVGYLAIEGHYIDRLYVHPGRQRQGIGCQLMKWAMERSPAGLQLHTHVKNERARRFYEKHGFEAVKFGTSPAPESEPDVEYHWRP